MKLKDIAEGLSLTLKTPDADLERQVNGGYVSDLLSDVMGNAGEGYIWVTLQIHINTVAVASLKGLSGIIMVNGRMPEETTLQRAASEGVPVLTTPLCAFDVVGRLYSMGLRCR